MDLEEIIDSLEKLSLIAKNLTPKEDDKEIVNHPFAFIFSQLWPVIVIFFEIFQVLILLILFCNSFS